jgi:hypothetical protein
VVRAVPARLQFRFFSGSGGVSGVTQVQAGPNNFRPFAVAKVRIHELRTGALVGETASGADGAYYYFGVNPDFKFYAVAFDPSGVYDVCATADLQVLNQ